MFVAYVTHAAGDHDRLVVAPHFICRQFRRLPFECPEIAAQVRSPEFVVESRSTDRPVDHDLQRRRHAVRMRKIRFPRLWIAGDAQVRHGISREPCLRLRAETRCALVPNLAARAGGRAGKWRDGGGVIVRLHLHQDMYRLIAIRVLAAGRRRHQPRRRPSFDNGGIVRVRRDHAVRARLRGRPNHAEQPFSLRLTIDDPVGVENLVPAMFRICLREHHQFGVGRVALEVAVARGEIIDLVLRQGEAEIDICRLQRRASRFQERGRHDFRRFMRLE